MATSIVPDFAMRIGTAPVNWNNFDLDDWRPTVPYPAILDEMSAAGYVATEWDVSFDTDPGRLIQDISQRDMSYTGAYRWVDFLHHDAFRRDLTELDAFLRPLVDIGATHLIVADQKRPERIACAGAVPADGSKSLPDAGYASVAENLARLANHVAPLGIHVHYHNHVGTYIETADEITALVAHLADAPVDLCFDTGHYAYGGGNSLDFLTSHLDNIGYLHLKDVNATILTEAKRQGWSFLDALRRIIFCPLGEGNANIPAIVNSLVKARFEGWVIVEQDTCAGDATQTASQNLATMIRLAGDQGNRKDPEP